MRKFIYLSSVFALLIAVSCNKEEPQDIQVTTPVPPIYVPNYMPLEIGNYWVYEIYKIENHQETIWDHIDSIAIVGDTIIRNERYFQFGGETPPLFQSKWKILRDSSTYIVDEDGGIFFTLQDIGDVFYNRTEYFNEGDTVFNMQCHVAPNEESINIPAGDFNAMNKITDFITFPQSSTADSIKYRSINSYFIDGVGQSTNSIFYASSNFHWEKRLIRYHIVDKEE